MMRCLAIALTVVGALGLGLSGLGMFAESVSAQNSAPNPSPRIERKPGQPIPEAPSEPSVPSQPSHQAPQLDAVPSHSEPNPNPSGTTDPQVQQNTREYLVEKGDTLARIAERFLGSRQAWRTLADANGIKDPARLKVGQRLTILEVHSGS
jgi:nucleoid-associated protein YgaU